LKNSFPGILLSIRWPNLLITVLTIAISYFFLLIPTYQKEGIALNLDLTGFFLIILSIQFFMAGGYIINDWMDVESDFANQKGGDIKLIPRGMMLTSYLTVNIIGMILAVWLCQRLSNYQLLSIPLITILLLLLYSTNLKSTPLAGNIIIAVFCGMVPLLPLIFDQGFRAFNLDFNHVAIYFLAFFAFLLTLVRELVKDMEDEFGDKESNLATFPVIFGIEAARWTSFIFILLFFLFMALMLYLFIDRDTITTIYLLIFVVLPMIYLTYKMIKAESKEEFHRVSSGIKWVMLSGLIFAIVYYFSYL